MNIPGLVPKRAHRSFILFLIVLAVIGIGLRLRAISSFDFYPDSYKFMLMAREFARSGSPNGQLGPEGDLFIPNRGPVYKWGYPMMMSLPAALGADPRWTGHALATLAGFLCPFAAFAFLFGLCRRIEPALAAFALTVFSYEINAWSGYVLSDIPALATGMFGLAALANAKRELHRILAGLLVGWACVIRTELLLLALPCVLLMLNQKQGWRAFPSFLVPFGLLFFGTLAYLARQIPKNEFLMGGHTSSLFDMLWGYASAAIHRLSVKILIHFAVLEGPLTFCAGLGFLGLVRQRRLGFLLLSLALIMPLILTYQLGGNHQHRYYVQIIPGLLIPASLWLGQKDWWGNLWPGRAGHSRVGRACVAIALAGMGIQAVAGVAKGHRQEDYRTELGRWVASLKTQGKILDKDVIFTIDELAVHLETGLSCRGIRRTPPCVDVGGLVQDSEVVFVIDDYLVGRKMPGFRENLVSRSGLLASTESVALLNPVYRLKQGAPRRIEAFRAPLSVAGDLVDWQ